MTAILNYINAPNRYIVTMIRRNDWNNYFYFPKTVGLYIYFSKRNISEVSSSDLFSYNRELEKKCYVGFSGFISIENDINIQEECNSLIKEGYFINSFKNKEKAKNHIRKIIKENLSECSKYVDYSVEDQITIYLPKNRNEIDYENYYIFSIKKVLLNKLPSVD